MTNGSPDTWLSLHCFLRSAPEDVDAFLTEDVTPLLDGLGAGDWFFIRYDEGGHHLRLRVRGVSPARAASLPEALARLAERVPVAESVRGQDVRGHHVSGQDVRGQAEHAEVRVEPYVPETARYGGPAALPVAEEVFILSSRVAVRAVRDTPRGSARLALAIDLAHATALACGMDRLSAAQWLRRHAASWRWAEDVPLLGPRHVHAKVNSVYALQREVLAGRARALRQALEEGTATGVPADWYDGVRKADPALRSASSSVGRPYVWASQLHMLFNRLGLAPDEERAVCRLAARTLLDRGSISVPPPNASGSPSRPSPKGCADWRRCSVSGCSNGSAGCSSPRRAPCCCRTRGGLWPPWRSSGRPVPVNTRAAAGCGWGWPPRCRRRWRPMWRRPRSGRVTGRASAR
ncbi:hypothetical protein SCYAM73S_02127 [Streptomyces cyaneofuscatus]